MALAAQIQSGSGATGVADVDGNNNLNVTTPLVSTQAGFASLASENDHGTVTGTRNMKALVASDDNRLQVGSPTPLFDWNFNGTAQATGQWKCLFTLMTITESGGSLLLNANSTASTNSGCALSTWAYFKQQGGGQLALTFVINVATNVLEAGQIVELGGFVPTATTAPGDGWYFRLTSAGSFGVVNFNGTETVISLPSPATLTAGTTYSLRIVVNDFLTEFWISTSGVGPYVLAGTVPTPSGNGVPASSVSLPATVQQRNAGAITGTQAQLKVFAVHVEQSDLQTGMPSSHLESLAGLMGYQGLEGGTAGSTASIANSGALTPAALSNVGALITGLGGVAAVNPTLAVGTDGLVFDYTVPAGGVSQVPRKFVITGVQVQGCVSTVLAGGPVSYFYQLAFGHTGVGLATTESTSFATTTSKAPRKIAIGMDTYAATAAVGVLGSVVPLELDLSQSPATVNPGEHIAIVARNLGVVTTSGAITLMATVKGYWV
jgi:hypothetical protein